MTSKANQPDAALRLSLFLAAFFVLWTLRATVFLPIDESIVSPTARAGYSNLLKFIIWVLPAAAYARWLRNAPPVNYLGLSTVPSRRVWRVCLGVTFGFLLAVTLVELAIGRKTFSAAGLSSLPSVLGLLQFMLTPLLEEILFRGLVMKECLTLLPVPAASALTSLLFVGAARPA